jgi:hypothetical protein
MHDCYGISDGDAQSIAISRSARMDGRQPASILFHYILVTYTYLGRYFVTQLFNYIRSDLLVTLLQR